LAQPLWKWKAAQAIACNAEGRHPSRFTLAIHGSPPSDPAGYAESSAIDYIENVRTPTLVVVGHRDGESPAPRMASK